jgi:hypothetical protein
MIPCQHAPRTPLLLQVTYAILKELGLFKAIPGTDGTEVYA